MPPTRLVKKVIGYELSESKKHTKSRKARGSASISARKRPSKAKKKTNNALLARASSAAKNSSAAAASSARPKAKTTKKAAKSSGALSTSKSAATTTKLKAKTAKRKTTTTSSGNSAVGADAFQTRIESSPNARAKCRCCGKRIEKLQQRIAIPIGTTSRRLACRYYHTQCFPQQLRSTLPQQILQQLNTDIQGIQQDAIENQQNAIEMLREFRRLMEDEALELRFGATEDPPEVIVIDDSDDEEDDGNDTLVENITQATPPSLHNHGGDDSDDGGDGDDDIAVEETLTCAQVVQQKFDRAAANGEIVAID
jgi:hypothetical protein